MKNEKKLILGASIGNCVHVAGVVHFLSLARQEGFDTVFLGPAVPVDKLFSKIYELRPYMVGISYRLTPENVVPLLDEIEQRQKELPFPVIWDFGGTKPVADIARRYSFIDYVSDGFDDINDTIRFLRGGPHIESLASYGKTLEERIDASYPYPILRHHYGRPTMEETVQGVAEIAQARVLDVISLGPDQNAQQFFFHPENMKREFTGAGGVPIRSAEDLQKLKEASQCGNYPLMRCYSGTEDVFPYAKMLLDTIDNAWTAIPLCWYNELDGRGSRKLEVSMREAQALIRWHAENGIPVELNEPHHWGLRDAPDVIAVAMAYISAYNAKKLGVRQYVAQYMFNNPSGLSFSMDLAKILAMIEMVESLKSSDFKIYRETRAGLALFHADEDVAKGQLAASTFMQMAVKPHIVHVVGYCEADHAARSGEVIESCKIAKGVIRHVLNDHISIAQDSVIQERKAELMREAQVLIDFILQEYGEYDDPLANADVLCDCIRKGYIDAVHILKNQKFRGDMATSIIDGKCVAVHPGTGKPLNEKNRLLRLKEKYNREQLEYKAI